MPFVYPFRNPQSLSSAFKIPTSNIFVICLLPSVLCHLAIIIFVKKIKTLRPERSPSWYTQITQPEIFVDKIEIIWLALLKALRIFRIIRSI
jgi:hypothetical protein